MSPAPVIYISRFSAWAPRLESRDAWRNWAMEDRKIPDSAETPALEFADPLFRRRLSRISRMTVQVLHDLLPLGENTKILFFSFRGEITRQLGINRQLIEEQQVSPAAFSLSVFNAPAAAATIALGLRAGYSAVYPGDGCFETGLLAAAAPVAARSAEYIAMVYADEPAPEEYGPLCPEENSPLALGAILSRRRTAGALPLEGADAASPEAFLRSLLRREVPYGSP